MRETVLPQFNSCNFKNLPLRPTIVIAKQTFRRNWSLSNAKGISFRIKGKSMFMVSTTLALLILQPFHRFTYVTTHSPTLLSLYLCHSSFSNLSSFHRRYNSFFNPSVALPTSQLILQPFRCFTYVTAHSPALLSLLLRHLASRP